MDNRLSQVRLSNRLDKIGTYAELLAPLSIAPMANRSQHHDRGSYQLRYLVHLLCDDKAIHFWHMHIDKDQTIWFLVFPAVYEFQQSLRSAPGQCYVHAPS